MKKFNKNSIVAVMAVVFVFAVLVFAKSIGVFAIQPVSTPSLGTSDTYGILATHFQHNIAQTTITGDPANGPTIGVLGYWDQAGVGAVVVNNGTTYVNDSTWTAAGNAQNAALALLNDMGSCTSIDTPRLP